jgi:mono/diheme cytochrome c family protein
MKTSTLALATSGILLALICAPTGVPSAYAQARKSPAAKGTSESGDAARGKYLVEGVAMCGQCHTPRDGDGNLDRSKWLQGAPVPWSPGNGGMNNWPMIAPRIGGNPPASDADMVKLLTTGIWTSGKPLRFPMMPFRMSEADAKAVVAYLKSVTPGK